MWGYISRQGMPICQRFAIVIMQLKAFLVALAASASTYASCSGLGTGATDTVTTQFTLSAFDATSGTTTPLHLLIAFTQPGTSYHILSTNTGSSAGFPGFTLSSGALTTTAAPPPNQNLALAHFIGLEAPPAGGSSTSPTPAPWLLFANSFVFPSGVFCSVPSGSNKVLALNGVTNLFSLCFSSFTSQIPSNTALLFNASSTAQRTGPNTYDGSTCKPVTVLLV